MKKFDKYTYVNIFLSLCFVVSLLFNLVMFDRTAIAGERLLNLETEIGELIKQKDFLVKKVSEKTSNTAIFANLENLGYKKVSAESYNLPALALR